MILSGSSKMGNNLNERETSLMIIFCALYSSIFNYLELADLSIILGCKKMADNRQIHFYIHIGIKCTNV